VSLRASGLPVLEKLLNFFRFWWCDCLDCTVPPRHYLCCHFGLGDQIGPLRRRGPFHPSLYYLPNLKALETPSLSLSLLLMECPLVLTLARGAFLRPLLSRTHWVKSCGTTEIPIKKTDIWFTYKESEQERVVKLEKWIPNCTPENRMLIDPQPLIGAIETERCSTKLDFTIIEHF